MVMKLLLPVWLLLLVLALSVAAAEMVESPSEASPDIPSVMYVFTVSTTGETAVEVIVARHETLLPLPKDVLTPEIQGGRYESTAAGLLVVPEEAGAVIRFSSSRYTRKEDGVWHFFADVAPHSTANVTLPFSVKVVQARPRPFIAKTAAIPTLALFWSDVPTNISFSYAFLEGGSQGQSTEHSRASTVPRWIAVPLIILLAVAAGLALLWHRKQAKQTAKRKMAEHAAVPAVPTGKNDKEAGEAAQDAGLSRLDEGRLTDGQMNILRAANHNEALVLRVLLRHNGQLKRNALEKESGLSKSSLASSVHNLEKKNLIEVDRTFHVHYVTLSKWFKELL